MWDELADMSDPDQIVAAADYIAEITRTVLPALARHRRLTVVKLVERDGWDSRRVAETIGSRKNSVDRLVEEGRAIRRSEGG